MATAGESRGHHRGSTQNSGGPPLGTSQRGHGGVGPGRQSSVSMASNNSGEDSKSSKGGPAPKKVDVFQGKKLFGDLFGNNSSFESLGYRSRAVLVGEPMMNDPELYKSQKRHDDAEKDLQISSQGSIGSLEDFRSDSESENEVDAQLTPKQQLALTIRNWCSMPENDDRVIHEGGVTALIQLSSTDDPLVKKSCASAFYLLSTRERNRSNLVQLGAVTGVIAIAMQVRSWKVAKLVAMCLCNLSMEPNGEVIMAKEGAILAIGILMGIKSQRLLPICVHTLYNLTCVEQFYKGMDRIAKALLNVPTTAFDHTGFMIKALCNCARYSWMRVRLIEDGVISSFVGLVPTLADRADSVQYVEHMLTCLASLSESSTGCRTDMLQRGTVDLLEQLLPYCTTPMCRYYTIKVMHSLLEIVRLMTPTVFETAVHIVVEVLQAIALTVEDLVNVETRQYACCCLLAFTREHMRGVPYLFDITIAVLPELLPRDDPLTQFFSVTASGNIFEHNTCKSVRDLEPLLKLVIVGGQGYRDPSVIQAVAITLAKISIEVKYLQLMEKNDLLGRLLEKLLILVEIAAYSSRHNQAATHATKAAKTGKKFNKMFGGDGPPPEERRGSTSVPVMMSRPPSPPVGDEPPSARFIAHELAIKLNNETVAVVRECACTAITRVALCLGGGLAKNLRQQLAMLFTEFLACDDYSVINNTITSIRSLGERGLCEEELLADLLFERVANIVNKYGSDLALVRNCCAVLWVFSYNPASHRGLASRMVMDMLFRRASAEDSMTRELVAATLCNISVDADARQPMIDMGVVQVLETLSGTTSGLIQELCAKCLCNLTCAEPCHDVLINHQALQVIIMIALLRAVATATKLLCAKALLNLTRQHNHKALEKDGSIRVFATLSGQTCSDTQHTCARGFLMISSILSMRGDIIQRRTVVQALYSLLKSEAAQTRIMAGMAVCNILACPSTQGPSIQAGGLSVLKIIATMDYEELREATARVIITLLGNPSLHTVLAKEPLTQVLVLIAQQSRPVTFECAVKAFACMSQSDVFRVQLIDKGCVSALVSSVLAGKINTAELALHTCRCLCLLSNLQFKVEAMVVRCNVVLALHAIYRMGFCEASADTCAMIALILHNFGKVKEVRALLAEQEALKLLVGVSEHFSTDYHLTFRASIGFLHSLSQEKELHRQLVAQGMMKMLGTVIHSARTQSAMLTERDVEYIAMALNGITATPACHEAMVSFGIVQIVEGVSGSLNQASTHEMIAALCNMASSKGCRRYLVEQGAAQLIVRLSQSSPLNDTHDLCTLALGYLSEITVLNDGIVKSFLSLSLHPDDRHGGNGRGGHGHGGRGINGGDDSVDDNSSVASGADSVSMSSTGSPKPYGKRGVSLLKKAVRGNLSQLKQKMSGPMAASMMMASPEPSAKKKSERPVSGRMVDLAGSEHFTLDDEEKQLLLTHYDADQFSFIEYHASVEPGGMAAKFKINLPLPAIAAGSFAESVFDRSVDLPKFAVDQGSLTKSLELITDFRAVVVAASKRDAKADEGPLSGTDDEDEDEEEGGDTFVKRSQRSRLRSDYSDIALDEPDYDDIPALGTVGRAPSKSLAMNVVKGLTSKPSAGNLKGGRMGSISVGGAAGAGAAAGGGQRTASVSGVAAAASTAAKDRQHKALAKFFGTDPTKQIGLIKRTGGEPVRSYSVAPISSMMQRSNSLKTSALPSPLSGKDGSSPARKDSIKGGLSPLGRSGSIKKPPSP